MFYLKLIKRIKDNKQGVALFIVLTSMATLAIFLGEITYTSQINQKLAYDRLDQIKAHSLAKSGLRLSLLRIKAYSEIKKTVSKMAKDKGASAADVSAVLPKAVLEKIWSEPLTIPFSGDISSLPAGIKDALGKFRKDSGLEGKLYISIQAQSSKFNLNSLLPAFASNATPTPSPKKDRGETNTNTDTSTTTSTSTATSYDATAARTLLNEQLKDTFQKKFEEDEKFRDQYRNLKIDDLSEEIIGWADLSYQSQHVEQTNYPFKKAPFYHISELHYLPSVDDDIYELIAPQFTAGVSSGINVNTINEVVLKALVPLMTAEEVKKFYEFRDGTGSSDANSNTKSNSATDGGNGSQEDNSFKTPDDFFKYIKEKVAAFGNSDSKVDEFKKNLTQRGIAIITDENNFIVRIEATVQQTKRTLEAMVTIIEDNPKKDKNKTPPPVNTSPGETAVERSNIKITQLRFL